jgi:AmmeMemoRadiSam system protein B
MKTRNALFAGSWYPADARGCEQDIQRFVDEDPVVSALPFVPVGGIVPHAGWYFSGRIACNVIRRLAGEAPPDVLFVFGMHLHPGSANYIMADGAWETPFGDLEIDAEVASVLVEAFPFRIESAEQYTEDNTIELQLPFIKYFLPDVKIVPLGVPPTPEALKIGKYAVETALAAGRSVKVLGSTDLTHYGVNYGFTPMGCGVAAHAGVRQENDRTVIEAMLALDPLAVIREARACHNACCAGAAATAIAAAKKLGSIRAEQIAYATSYEKQPGSSFVGYVGILC